MLDPGSTDSLVRSTSNGPVWRQQDHYPSRIRPVLRSALERLLRQCRRPYASVLCAREYHEPGVSECVFADWKPGTHARVSGYGSISPELPVYAPEQLCDTAAIVGEQRRTGGLRTRTKCAYAEVRRSEPVSSDAAAERTGLLSSRIHRAES